LTSSVSNTEVLDHGYVKLQNIMGDDWTPVRAALVSIEEPLTGEVADTKLLRYLLTHKHTSPFEMVELQWEVKAPIFVARQWVRHRTANLNEFSMRYAEADRISEDGNVEFYVPANVRGQSTSNRQASGPHLVGADATFNRIRYEQACLASVEAYESLLRGGVSREQARAVLPLSTYTKFIWKNDLHNTLHFLDLRLGEGAQEEIRVYAEAMRDQMKEKLPVIMGLWEEIRGNTVAE
jgi:thymidylate synthase (FAD)